MDMRHLVTKSFDGMTSSKTIVYNGLPMCVTLSKKSTHNETILTFSNNIPDDIEESLELQNGLKALKDSPLSKIFIKDGVVRPLSQIFSFKVEQDGAYSDIFPAGVNFGSIFEDTQVVIHMEAIAKTMYPFNNPKTGKQDLVRTAFYSRYVPLVIMSGAMTSQMEDSRCYFNPDGTVTIAEFLDSLNAIKYGSNSNRTRKKTLDNISTEEDYFNEGYNSCLRGISSPFFNLYKRSELLQPITRGELAYITVLCWSRFIEKFNAVYGSTFFLGINFDWENPQEELAKFEDGFDYKVSKVCLDTEYDVISIDLHDYKTDKSMSDYKSGIKSGLLPISLPMLMSMLELNKLGLFQYGSRLDPLREVSRAELCYFLGNISKIFTMNYI